MPTGKSSPAAKALAYAENELKVHEVYEDALAHRTLLDKTLTTLSESRDTKRDLEIKLTDAEMEVTSDEWSKHPDMPVTRMDKHLKAAVWLNDACRAIREKIAKVQGDIDGDELDQRMLETDIRIAVARLTELGGYFQYLAAIKTAQPVKPVKNDKGEEA